MSNDEKTAERKCETCSQPQLPVEYCTAFDLDFDHLPKPRTTGAERGVLEARIRRSNIHLTPGTLNNLILRLLGDLSVGVSLRASYEALRREVLAYERNPTGFQFELLQAARKRLDEADRKLGR
ncbi:MAG: hypothetical protein GY838_13025 [bacterium]|nr:hypothetical protein [bacterium]